MGREILCHVRTGGKTATGKALLETSEIIFRGDPRLKIPFASLTAASARNGVLRLKWPEGSAVFELGEHAEKWAHAILHPKSRAEKLGIKRELTISTIAMRDDDFLKDLQATARKFSDRRALKDSDLIFLGAEKAAELSRVSKVAPSLSNAGALWIVYPKGQQEIREQQVFDAGKQAGLVDVKVVRFSETQTALKFVRPKKTRKPG
jgi:hypothetical protein